MYNHSGKKLKAVVTKITMVMMVISVISGIAIFAVCRTISDNLAVVGFTIGLIVAGIGCLTWWVMNLIIATFAELAINVEKIATHPLVNNNESVAITDDAGNAVDEMPNTKRAGYDILNYPHDIQNEWVCSSCTTVNKRGNKWCKKCGCGVALK